MSKNSGVRRPIVGLRPVYSRMLVGGCALIVAVSAFSDLVVAQQLQKVTLAMSSASMSGSTARYAKELGLFEKHGIDASVTAMENGSVAVAAMVSRSVDFVTNGPSDVIIAKTRGQNIVALGSTYRGYGAVLVLSKAAAEATRVSPTAPVSERLKALNGLTVASPSASSPFTIGVRSSADSAGAKINFVYMAQPAMVAALQTGAIQGMVVSAPFYGQAAVSGVGVVWISGPKGEFPERFTPSSSTLLLAMADTAKAKPELMKRMSDVFIDLGKMVTDNPAAVKAAIAKLFPDIDAKTMDILFETEKRALTLGPLTVAELAHDLAFMKSSGLDLPGIEKIKPDDLIFP